MNLTANHPISSNKTDNRIHSICFFSFDDQDALSELRLLAPARHLGLEVVRGMENRQVFPERAALADVIVMQRDFPRLYTDYERIRVIAQEKHIPLVLDLDDLLFELPHDHPNRVKHTFAASLLPTFQAILQVNLVTVTNPELRKYILNYNQNVTVLPNYLDDQVWQLKPLAKPGSSADKIIIGYMGGQTHPPDLALLIPVIKELIQRYPARLEFHFWGGEPPRELSNLPEVRWFNQITWNYQEFARYFQSQSADIFVAPLADNRFNACKSSIKYLEYGSMAVPGVFSNVAPYSSVIQPGVNGLLAGSTDEWLQCLTQLIESPDLRQSIGSHALADLQSNWLLSRNAERWLAAYQQAHEFMASSEATDQPYQKMLDNISHQVLDWDVAVRQQLEVQSKQMAELELTLAQRDATLAGIHQSRTWKWALFFRRLSELLVPRKR